jgi:hypothetical protein
MAGLSPVKRHPASFLSARVELQQRLKDRLPEIKQVALTRLYAVSEPHRPPEPEYMEGLHAALSAALHHFLEAIELGEERTPPPPAVVLMQARAAARWNITLDTVLRRCFAGYTLFGDFLMQEAEAGGRLRGPGLNAVLRDQAAVFDRLVASVTEEYGREARPSAMSSAECQTRRVERLLVGELVDTSRFNYEFAGCHLGAIGKGPTALAALCELASALDRASMLVESPEEEETVWAWFGGLRPLDPATLNEALRNLPSSVVIALGEGGEGLTGWRKTHRQARAALSVALCGAESVTRYGDVAVLSSALRDDLLASSLQEIFLAPLEAERDGGEALRATLSAYFAAERNVSSAAAALGVNRHTVTSRLRAIEERIGRPLGGCVAEIEVALRLPRLGQQR